MSTDFFITSAKEVTVSSALVILFACQQNYKENIQLIFTILGGKVAQKPLNFGGNPDHVTLELGYKKKIEK